MSENVDDSLIAQLQREVTGRDWSLRPVDGPFISVIVATENRPALLRDLLLCLSAQDDQDFEVVVATTNSSGAESAVRALVLDEVPQLAPRIATVPVASNSPAQQRGPLISEARGSYLCFVNESDLVLMNWISAFREGARSAPGLVLRSGAAHQACREVPFDEAVGYMATSPVIPCGRDSFALVDLLQNGQMPLVAYAFARRTFDGLGVRFNNDRSGTTDWEVQLEAIRLQGVHACPSVTAICRPTESTDSSRSDVEKARFESLVTQRVAGRVFLVAGEELLRGRDDAATCEQTLREKDLLAKNYELLYEEKIAEVRAKERLVGELNQLQTVGQLTRRLASALVSRTPLRRGRETPSDFPKK